MSNKKAPFQEQVFNALYDVFRGAGVALSVPQLESLRRTAAELSKVIADNATLKAIDLIERVQDRVKDAVAAIEKNLDTLQKESSSMIESLEKRLEILEEITKINQRTKK